MRCRQKVRFLLQPGMFMRERRKRRKRVMKRSSGGDGGA